MSKPIAANDNVHRDYYVYAWLRPCGNPFYIGKGRGKRDKAPKYSNPLFQRIVSKLKASGKEANIIRLHENLDENEAHRLECIEIARYGRRNNGTGILANLTDGGEGASGHIMSEETRAKIGAVHAGKRLGPEHRAKLLARISDPSDETRAKMSEAQKGRKHTDATLAKMSASNAMHRPEIRAKVSAALTGRVMGVEWRASMSAYARNRPASHNASISVNNRMRGPSSGYKGVSLNSRTGKWKVAIRIGDKRPFIGYFTDPVEAALAYDKAAIDAWGIGGCYLNFPEYANDNEQQGLVAHVT
ncbi:NUMOD3 domain-containing DNA-binding protein [Rhizobium ruizarguesonis]|uniref:NUMOD3 domain-containing DNA-binding protein n=1 Tax=Rhizobium ruizarguesonis TaxID=2081791 RepID=A0ACD5EMH0_9HYPH|nr:NUMOD3 domain-containing DNA-binding protein [Rhizobium leguminosarum]